MQKPWIHNCFFLLDSFDFVRCAANFSLLIKQWIFYQWKKASCNNSTATKGTWAKFTKIGQMILHAPLHTQVSFSTRCVSTERDEQNDIPVWELFSTNQTTQIAFCWRNPLSWRRQCGMILPKMKQHPTDEGNERPNDLSLLSLDKRERDPKVPLESHLVILVNGQRTALQRFATSQKPMVIIL